MKPVFSGRVVFDHLEKTAGQAVNAWLKEQLGNGVVTDNLIGRHGELIRQWGGEYGIISGHVHFDGLGLDPRYKYVTLLRDPIERAISYLYFVVNNFKPDDLAEWQSYHRFIESEGDEIDHRVLHKIPNYYVNHFAQAKSRLHRPARALLADALTVIDQYEVWGLYERMPEFLADLGRRLRIPPPARLTPVNETARKPGRAEISPKLVARLEELNALDTEFYRVLRDRHDAGRQERAGRPMPEQSAWAPYQRPSEGGEVGPDLSLLSVAADGVEGAVPSGGTIDFRLRLLLHRPLEEVIVGIHLHDAGRCLAFGTNTILLGANPTNLSPGVHLMDYRIAADLPEGQYRAGFAFLEPSAEGMRTLAWLDDAVSFRVQVARPVKSIGYCGLPATFEHRPLMEDADDPPEAQPALAAPPGRWRRWLRR